MRALPVALVGAWLLVSAGGCAALSLFGESHTHTHHHAAPESLEPRLRGIEERLSRLEQQPHQLAPPTWPTQEPRTWEQPPEPGF